MYDAWQDVQQLEQGKTTFSLVHLPLAPILVEPLFAMRLLLPLVALLGGIASAAHVEYTLTLTAGTAAPDGVQRDVYLVGGLQFCFSVTTNPFI